MFYVFCFFFVGVVLKFCTTDPQSTTTKPTPLSLNCTRAGYAGHGLRSQTFAPAPSGRASNGDDLQEHDLCTTDVHAPAGISGRHWRLCGDYAPSFKNGWRRASSGVIRFSGFSTKLWSKRSTNDLSMRAASSDAVLRLSLMRSTLKSRVGCVNVILRTMSCHARRQGAKPSQVSCSHARNGHGAAAAGATYAVAELVKLDAEKIVVLVKVLAGELAAPDHLVRELATDLLEQPEHLVVGLAGEEDLARVELVERAPDRPHVDRVVVRNAQNCRSEPKRARAGAGR